MLDDGNWTMVRPVANVFGGLRALFSMMRTMESRQRLSMWREAFILELQFRNIMRQ
jgi:hypothetical protein